MANTFYHGMRGDVLVLLIDPERLTAELRYEPPRPLPPDGSPLAGELFPHIYGPINREAIVAVRRAERAADGTFLVFQHD